MGSGQQIVEWYRENARSLPWREEKDPYRIWLSEIILQQTRVAQGLNYYLRFVGRFPELKDLAAADVNEVMKYWEGLGYYSRARNLHYTAKDLIENYGGKFPEDHISLLKLKGIGPYTARAISSFAFGEKVAVIDGNVFRVITRFLGDPSPIDKISTRNRFQKILDGWISKVPPEDFNQGIMELGALVCVPRNPKCPDCPLQTECKAYQSDSWADYPVKAKKLIRKIKYFNFFFVVNEKKQLAILLRPQKGIWGGLWDIPNQELSREEWDIHKLSGKDAYLGELKHVFTHFDMMIRVYLDQGGVLKNNPDAEFITKEKIPNFAFSKGVLKIFDGFLHKIL